MGVLHCLYVYNRHGTCLYYEEWNREHHGSETQYDDEMLMFGLVFSMRELTKQMSPTEVTSFNTFNSAEFKVHDFQTATGLRFILCSDHAVEDLTKHLLNIYKNIYVEYVSKNPLSALAVMPPTECQMEDSVEEEDMRIGAAAMVGTWREE